MNGLIKTKTFFSPVNFLPSISIISCGQLFSNCSYKSTFCFTAQDLCLVRFLNTLNNVRVVFTINYKLIAGLARIFNSAE